MSDSAKVVLAVRVNREETVAFYMDVGEVGGHGGLQF